MDQRVNDDLLLIDYFLSDDFLLQEELKDIGMVVRKTKKNLRINKTLVRKNWRAIWRYSIGSSCVVLDLSFVREAIQIAHFPVACLDLYLWFSELDMTQMDGLIQGYSVSGVIFFWNLRVFTKNSKSVVSTYTSPHFTNFLLCYCKEPLNFSA